MPRARSQVPLDADPPAAGPRDPQVAAAHYAPAAGYDTRRRFISYWNQIDQIGRADPATLLEVGIGNGFLHRYLRRAGRAVHTVDLDPALEPDTVASIHALPFADASFDVVACFETLEHLPWGELEPALRELRRVAARLVLISVPDVTPYLRLRLEAGFRRVLVDRALGGLPLPARPHVFDGQHHWELGKRGYPLSALRRAIERVGLRELSTHRDHDDPFHRFLVCAR